MFQGVDRRLEHPEEHFNLRSVTDSDRFSGNF